MNKMEKAGEASTEADEENLSLLATTRLYCAKVTIQLRELS